jgi:CHAD domain-containing protein
MNPEDHAVVMNGVVHDVAPRVPHALVPVEVRLHESIRTFAEAVDRARADDDPEAFHDVRVAARRLTEFLHTWRDMIPGSGLRRILRGLRAIRRRAGRARDIEVQVAMLRERIAAHAAPDAEARELLRTREARLERRRRRTRKRLGARKGRRLMDDLAGLEQDLDQDLLSHLHTCETAHAHPAKREAAARVAVGNALDAEDDARLHAARIAIKRWRYAVESLGEGGDQTAATLAALRALQETLGGILDRGALRTLLAKRTAAPGPNGSAGTLTALIADLDAERSGLLQRFRALGAELRPAVESPPAYAHL